MFFSYLHKPLEQVLNNNRDLVRLFLLIFIILSFNKVCSKTPKELIQESIANYPGKCPCPYSIKSNGKKCGKNSAYSKPGGYEPLCYFSDITDFKNVNLSIHDKTRVIDGDTIYVNKIKYRLYGIDAPEIKQQCKIKDKNYNCGVKSKDFLASLISDKSVSCYRKDIDRYKRIVAECFVNQINLNKELVRNGWALAYRQYSKEYIKDEEFAKKNKLGIWKGTFIEPKKWRKLYR